MKRLYPLAAGLLGIFLFLSPGAAAEPVSVAPLDIQNMNGTADLDYLQGIIQGLLLFDLSSGGGVRLVDRRNLDRVLAEQSLQLSGMTAQEGELLEVGRLTGARYLLRGTYVFLGSDLLLSLTLVDTSSGEEKTFSRRGHTENLVHELAEEVVLAVTGERKTFQNADSRRSILSLQDETPGTIVFYSPMVDGEIYLDEEFVGYTTGDPRVPFRMENLSPGDHTIRIWMGRNFGEVKKPEFTFGPWSTVVTVAPGKEKVIRDGTREFNGAIYEAQQIVRESWRFPAGFSGTQTLKKEFSYLDRQGQPVNGSLTVVVRGGKVLELEILAEVNGKTLTGTLSVPAGRDDEFRQTIESLDCSVEGELRSDGSGSVDWEMWRNDIRQGMFWN